jgi:hypothetical protein
MGEDTANIIDTAKGVVKALKGVDERIWPAIDILGMLLLAVGAVLIMWSVTSSTLGPAIIMGAGIVLIVIASTAVGFQGRKLRKKYEGYQRVDEVRTGSLTVPDDSKEGYMIDYTAPYKVSGLGRFKLTKKPEGYRGPDGVKREAHSAPNDLEERYLIDYTAEQGGAAVRNNEQRDENGPGSKF